MQASIRNSLLQAGKEDAAIEAEVVVRHVLQVNRTALWLCQDQEVNEEDREQAAQILERRVHGEPLKYITGVCEFYGLDFFVDPRVMIPRQETELLIEKVIEFASGDIGPSYTIADVGVGSGTIAVTLAYHLGNVSIVGTDVSSEALDVARINANRHGVSNKIQLLAGDLLGPIDCAVDVIVSNPPYLTSKEMIELPNELKKEPKESLYGCKSGLAVTYRLIEQAQSYLKPGGLMVIEIGAGQAKPVMELARQVFLAHSVHLHNDLAGKPRAVSCRAAAI